MKTKFAACLFLAFSLLSQVKSQDTSIIEVFISDTINVFDTSMISDREFSTDSSLNALLNIRIGFISFLTS